MNQLTTSTRLDVLAAEIQEATAKCHSVAMDSLEHAKEAGELLVESKKLCEHGKWEKWVQENCNLPTRTSRAFMQIANSWPEIEAKRQSIAVLGLLDATRLIAQPKKNRKKKVTESQTSEGPDQTTEPEDQPDTPEEDTGPEGEIPPEFEDIFATRQDFKNIENSSARIREIPYIFRNNITKIKGDFLPRINAGIPEFPIGEFSALLKDIEKTINTNRLVALLDKLYKDLKYFEPQAVCSCYKDGEADSGCERCMGTGYRSKDE